MTDELPAIPNDPPTSLAPLSPLSIERTRALWRNLAWQLLPETFVGAATQQAQEPVPDAANAALLAMVRGLHSTAVHADATQERAASAQHLQELLAAGPTPVLQRAPDDPRQPSRLDLAAELLACDGLERLTLELLAVSELDPVTSHSVRVLAGRLGRGEANHLELLDDALALAGLGVGVVRRLCGPRGALRRNGAITAQGGLSEALLAFLDDAETPDSPLREHEVRLMMPGDALRSLAETRAPWLDLIGRALAARRPLLVSGAPGFGAAALVALLAQSQDLPWRGVHAMPLCDVARQQPSELMPVLHAEARLGNAVWLLHHFERLEAHFRAAPDSLRRWLDALLRIDRPLILAHEGPVAPELASQLAIEAGLLHIEVPALAIPQREDLMRASLEAAGVADETSAALAIEGRQYSLGPERVVAAVAHAQQRAQLRAAQSLARGQEVSVVAPTAAELRLACTSAMTTELRAYGSRVHTTATWDDLVLDAETLDAVRNLSRFAKVRDKLFSDWGFGRAMPNGRALSAMFSGPSGTGKTMVAGLIAKDLGVELYRVDLSRVVSKYIGETEERLGALFSEAAQVGAALLFDEADSLFSQRTEVKSSNDRYANLEVNYLLQRLEEFDGVVILTTNFATSIDEAFVRRVRFRVPFPFPSAQERERLWEVMLPPELPQDDEGIDFAWLGQGFELSGGHVRNAVLRGAMYAATADQPLSMRMLYEAAAAEYRELGKLAPHYPFDD